MAATQPPSFRTLPAKDQGISLREGLGGVTVHVFIGHHRAMIAAPI
jgi:hypothetical protein